MLCGYTECSIKRTVKKWLQTNLQWEICLETLKVCLDSLKWEGISEVSDLENCNTADTPIIENDAEE